MNKTDEKRKMVAQRLRAAREQAGLSQGQVAKMLEWHRPTISEIEAGRRKVSVDEITRFSNIYNVSVSWLTEEEPAFPDPKVELAAREITKLKPDDFDKVIQLLRRLKKSGDNIENE